MQCYAAHLGNCRDGISKEYYISRSVLEIAGKVVQVTGFPWQTANESKEIGIESLVSKILCRHHNSQLSPLDKCGEAFLLALKSSFDDAAGDGEFTDEVFFLEGDKIELWLLKILCGLLASTSVEMLQKWINILFVKEPFPDDSGLHIFGQQGSSSGWFFNLVRVILVRNKSGKIAGAKFGIGGLALLLSAGKPTFSELGIVSIYRLESIIFEKDTKTKKLNFSWGNYIGQGSFHFNIDKPIEAQDFKYRPIVRPYSNIPEKDT